MPSRAVHRPGAQAIVLSIVMMNGALADPPLTCGPAGSVEGGVKVFYDQVQPDGSLRGGSRLVRGESLGRWVGLVPISDVTMVLEPQGVGANGDNRFDLVFVGDGYRGPPPPTIANTTAVPPDENLPPTATDFQNYERHVGGALYRLFDIEPFRRYRPVFRSFRVDVRSNESGVSNDPVEGVMRDTAMDMRFWCDGVERLLCVNTIAAQQYADQAPFLDLIVAVANSTKYGGSGYLGQNVLTISGGSSTAYHVTAHEIGHVLGILADEYAVDELFEWPGGEPSDPNLSTFEAPDMVALNGKWAAWIDNDLPGFDGPIWTYEGGGFYQGGVFRPSPNSAMRTIGRPFNVVALERLVVGIYTRVDPIDSVSPASAVATPNTVFSVEPIPVVGAPLTVQWFLNGMPLSVPVENVFDLSTITLPPGIHQVSARVADPTNFVRSQALRDQWLTQTRNWIVEVPAAGAAGASLTDAAAALRQWGESGAGLEGDVNRDGRVDLRDLLRALGARE